MKTIVHVNQHAVKANTKHGTNNPVLTVKTYKSNTYAHEVEMPDGCKVIHSPQKPLSCGARVWIETHGRVIIDGQVQGSRPVVEDQLDLF